MLLFLILKILKTKTFKNSIITPGDNLSTPASDLRKQFFTNNLQLLLSNVVKLQSNVSIIKIFKFSIIYFACILRETFYDEIQLSCKQNI